MKQSLTSILQYADDQKGWIPKFNTPSNLQHCRLWSEVLMNGGWMNRKPMGNVVAALGHPAWYNPDNRCPLEYKPTTGNLSNNISFGMISVNNGTTGQAHNLHLSKIKQSSQFAIIGDSIITGTKEQRYCIVPAWTSNFMTRHNGKGNLGFIDGHVTGVRRDEIHEYADICGDDNSDPYSRNALKPEYVITNY